MKKIFTTFLIVFSVTFCKAQWVTIPDTNFVSYLQLLYPSCMNGNLLDTTCVQIINETSVTCNGDNISDLTGIQYFDSLTTLACAGNNLTSLPSLPQFLDHLHCIDNNLTSLPPLPQSLYFLDCSYNSLTSLPALPNKMYHLNCSFNYLNGFSYLPDSMTYFNASNNPGLMCLPLIPHFLFPGQFIIHNTGIVCLSNAIQHIGNIPAIDTMPICGIFNPNGCSVYWNISGKVYFDANNNCIYDSNDYTEPNIQVQLWFGGALVQQIFSGSNGAYTFFINTSGTYEIKIDSTLIPISISCPSNGIFTSIISAIDSVDNDNDFAFICNSDYDVVINSFAQDSGWIAPGRKSLINISAGDFANFYGANCINGIGGQLQVVINGSAQYAGYATGSLAPTTFTGNTITWNIADFGAVDFFHDFHIRLLTDNTALIGSQVCIDATVTSNPVDVNQNNNHLNQCFTVVNSFDPNVKEVFPNGLLTPNDYLTYTIHFQNTGTAAAEHIQIIDTLDTKFDFSSFQLLAYSHPNMTQVLEGGIIHFNFPNINLPDSGSNEPASHGYIQYKIKPKLGTENSPAFYNTASIYFDFNSPVVTNTTITEWTTGIQELPNQNELLIYPNPVTDNVIIKLQNGIPMNQIEITDVVGRKVFAETLNQKSAIINLQTFSSGVYFIKVQLQNGEMQVKKFVIAENCGKQ